MTLRKFISSDKQTTYGSTLAHANDLRTGSGDDVPGPRKARVVVRDVAYATYRAVLYYVSPRVFSSSSA